jgi:aryl-alcohol dehydrogenase-like predicted oxidoreductase
MHYIKLGMTGLDVSPIAIGAMTYGEPDRGHPVWSKGVQDACPLIRHALEVGINFFDTANGYGRAIYPGRTEEIIGEWFAKDAQNREKTVLATKVYGDMGDGSWPNTGRLSALNIRKALDASLKRLQTDYVDLYQFHHIDRFTPWEEIWQAMEVAVQQGKVLYAGSSNFAGWHIAQAQEAAARRNYVGLVSEQSLYNLIQRDIEREVLPAAEAYGLGVIPWSPLHGGLLGGVIRKENEGVRRLEGRSKETLEKLRPQIEQYEEFADQLGHEPGELALAWLLHQPAVTGPIVGPRTMEQLESAVRAVDIKLDEKALARLDEIFPGYKTAPEDYAW